MNFSSKTDRKMFNLLSIGQRGVGKTVFLAGSYAELDEAERKNVSGNLWFECQDKEAQKNVDSILAYVAQTGQYPPPTMKISDFNFSLKRRSFGKAKTVCHFRWWDIPGESCDMNDPDFQKMVLSSHSCCVFINSYSLIHHPGYLPKFEESFKQVLAIASLVNQHGLKYAFALIFTQCDRLESEPIGQLQIESKLQPILNRLDAVNAVYKKFYSAIPIVSDNAGFKLKPKGAASPMIWLCSELNNTYSFRSPQDLERGLTQEVTTRRLSLSPRKYLWVLILGSVGLLGAIAAVLFAFDSLTKSPQQAQNSDPEIQEYQTILEREPNNLDALTELTNIYIARGQLDEAIPLMKKIVQQDPGNLEWKLNLAKLYELTDQKNEAETVYDQILVRQKNNLSALLAKAVLRTEKGDTETAKALFVQAEQAAPTEELKQKIRDIAEDTFSLHNKESSPSQ